MVNENIPTFLTHFSPEQISACAVEAALRVLTSATILAGMLITLIDIILTFLSFVPSALKILIHTDTHI